MRLKDVARIALGAESYGHDVHLNGDPIAGFAILLAPDANALEVADAVRAKMDELDDYFPPGVSWLVPYDTTQFISISIHEVLFTLVEAVVLVFLVILLFLQNLRATLIPTLVVPVALTSAFAGMYIAGFSINVLTLFGLVLAIGLVVDDAIVVVENVERIMTEEGLSPKEATRKAMGQITGAVIAMTTVLAAVFIPMALVGGSVGVIYRQFSLTIAISMAISALMALSFTPALCATLLKPVHEEPNPFLRGFNRLYGGLTRAYLARVRPVDPPYAALDGGVCRARRRRAAAVHPAADQLPARRGPGLCAGHRAVAAGRQHGTHRGGAARRWKASSRRTRRWKGARRRRLQLRRPGRERRSGLHPPQALGRARARRTTQINAFIQWANGALQSIKGARMFVVNLPTIRGLGRFGGFDFRLEDRAGLGHDQLMQARNTLLAKAAQNPGAGRRTSQPVGGRAGTAPGRRPRAGEIHGPVADGHLRRHPPDAGAGLCQRLQLPGPCAEGDAAGRLPITAAVSRT